MAVIIPPTGSGDATPSVATYTTAGGASGTHSQIVHSRPEPAAVARISSTAINSATSGNNTLVSGTTGETIRVMGLFIGSTGAQTWRFKSSTGSDLFPSVPVTAAGHPMVWPITGEPYVTTTAGGDLILFQSTSVQISGRCYYTKST